MFEFLLYFTPTYIIGYFIVKKLCKTHALFDYINGKTSRRVIGSFIIFGIFILISALSDSFSLSENISTMLLGLNLSIMCTLVSKIKYSKSS